MIDYLQPSELVKGEVQVGHQLVDQILSTNPPTYLNAENFDDVPMSKGCPVTNHGKGVGILRANATALSKACIGLLAEDIATNHGGIVQTSGVLVLRDWTPIAGTQALASKALYFLSLESGRLTTVSPSAVGQIVQPIGMAVSSVALSIDLGTQILL